MIDGKHKALALKALACLDLTNLDEACTSGDIEVLCRRAMTPHGHAAAICIWPRFVAQARKLLADKPVRIATVVNFPHGGDDVEAAVAEALRAIEDGTDEIDLVMAWRHVGGNPELVSKQVAAVREATRGKLLKVILETGEFGEENLIRRASEIAIQAGADFIKTSTGKVTVNATPEAARIMLSVIAENGGRLGFKPAGGIRTLEDARGYLVLAGDIMGPDWAGPSTFRFGATSLLDAILAELGGEAAPAAGTY